MEPLALYIHWPFCLAKCPYCDFNSHVREAIPQARFRTALRQELAWEAARLGRRRLTSIFFGGGTPSLMEPDTVAELIADAENLFNPIPAMEITLEANPTSVEAGRFAAYRQAGINRVSIGIQSLHDADLKKLGRQHSAAQAIAALEIGRKIFPRLSFDLIYARPGQTLPTWQAELKQALSLAADHLSLYQLTIEPGTAYFDLHARGSLVTPTDDRAADLYDVTQELTGKAGLPAYEISNHAVAGHESRHNLLYWRYGEYAGVGPGAHSRLGRGANRRAISAEKHPETWRNLVAAQGHGIIADTIVTPAEQASEYLLMGLRISEGIDLDRYAALAGRDIDSGKIAGLKSMGLIKREGSRLKATPDGRKLLNALIAELAV